MPLHTMQTLTQRQRCETGPSASGCIHRQNDSVNRVPHTLVLKNSRAPAVGRRPSGMSRSYLQSMLSTAPCLPSYANLHGAQTSSLLADANYALRSAKPYPGASAGNCVAGHE